MLAAIEAMKNELRAEMKAKIDVVKVSVNLDEKLSESKLGQPSNYFDSHLTSYSFVKRGCNTCRQGG